MRNFHVAAIFTFCRLKFGIVAHLFRARLGEFRRNGSLDVTAASTLGGNLDGGRLPPILKMAPLNLCFLGTLKRPGGRHFGGFALWA